MSVILISICFHLFYDNKNKAIQTKIQTAWKNLNHCFNLKLQRRHPNLQTFETVSGAGGRIIFGIFELALIFVNIFQNFQKLVVF